MSYYIPLKVFSAFSLQDSVIDIKSLVNAAEQFNLPAIGLVDRSNMFAMVSFYQKALSKGIKPLLGSSVVIKVLNKKINCSVYCKNIEGFRDLSEAISSLFKKNPFDNVLDLSAFQSKDSLVVIVDQDDVTGFKESDVILLEELKKVFGPDQVFMGLERYIGDKNSHTASLRVLSLAEKYQIPAVVANKVFFLQEQDYESQQIKYCIQKGQYYDDQQRVIKHKQNQYLYSYNQIKELFGDCLQAIENTTLIAKKCTTELDFDSIFLPAFSDDENLTLKEMSLSGLKERRQRGHLYHRENDVYIQRLEEELHVIKTMGFAGYFLIVADFIQWAKENHIAVGPGRGSGAGSLVAYALKITDLDPLRYNLLFERFLNPERVSMPDFDIDFCMEKRDLVIQYVQKRYGTNNVSQIATFGTMAAKAVVRDVGRVLNHSYGFVDKIAKLIPMDIGMTLTSALEQSDPLRSLYHSDEVVRDLIDLALKLEGLPRNIGKHAGGVVIAPKSLDYFCPLYNEPNTPWQPVSQLDKDDIERIGLVKFDFLGLRTLTVLDWTYKNLFDDQDICALENLPLDCPLSFEQLQAANTTAVFQLESRGMKQLILKLKPDCFEDMIALVALFRPGPLQSGMVDDFIDRKHGRAEIVYLHPALEEILKPTYGVILYQEQVMQIAQVLAGYSLGQADLLRRAMGKKKPEEMAKQREIFLKGCQNHSVDADCAMEIFDLMEKFAGYGFNKSHSAAYALIAYQTLYLKVHAKAAFFAANMSADYGNLDKIKNLVIDAKEDGIEVIAPDINQSHLHFKPIDTKRISYGLIAIKGLGEQVIEGIIEQRDKGGPFDSFDDFMQRTAGIKIQRRTLEVLAQAGVFDKFLLNRKCFVDILIEKKVHQYYLSDQKQGLLFDFEEVEEKFPFVPDYLWSEKLKNETNLLGISFSGEILDPYKKVHQKIFSSLENIQSHSQETTYLVCASPLRELTTGAGKKIAIFNFFDGRHSADIVVGRDKNEELIENYCELQKEGKPLIAVIQKTTGRNKKEYLNLDKLALFEDYVAQNCTTFEVEIDYKTPIDKSLEMFLCEIAQSQLQVQISISVIDTKKNISQKYYNPNAFHGESQTLDTLIEKAYSLNLNTKLY